MKKQFQSKTYPQGSRTLWRYLSALIILFTFAIGNVWADEIFGFTVTSSTTAKGSYSATGGTAECSGAAMSTGGSNEITVGTQTFYKFSSSSLWTFTLSSGKFAAGDVISFTGACTTSNKTGKGFAIQTSPVIAVTGDFPASQSNVVSYTVVADDGIAGQSSFSIKRNDSDIKFGTVSVTRSSGGGEDPVCPSGLSITSKNDKTAFLEGDAIELTAALTAGNGAITYQWYKGGTAEGNKLTGKTAAKLEIASCVEGDAGDYYCVASKSDCSDAVNADAFTITVAHNPCATHHWFVATADATTNGVTNWNGFTNTVTGSNNQNNSVTIDGTTYTLTKRTGSTGGGGTILGFTIPANKAGTLYGYMKSSGSAARTLSLKKGDDVVKTNTEITDGNWTLITISAIAPGTYTLSPDQNVQIQMFALKVCDATFHTITLDLDGGTGATSIQALDGVPATKPADPTKDNADFVKWVVKSTGADYNWSANVTGDLTLKAIWAAWPTLTLAAGEGATGDPIATQYKAGTEISVPEKPEGFSKGTDVFMGWAYSQEVTVADGKFDMPSTNLTLTAQWAAASNFDVKFYQGYGEPDTQIGETQSIATGAYATAPATDPTREGFNFKGWSYDATEEHIVNVAEYAITAATNFSAIWKQVFAVTFDGAGSVNVESGSKVASPDSPSQAGKVFLGWYNGESKWNFADNVTAAMPLTSKWEDADANHFYYNYKDAFHYDGFAYKTPEGKVDEGAGASNIAITTPYTLFSGAEGITSIVATKAIYDSKSNWVNAYLKINTSADSYLTFTIASGYTAVLKMKMGGYSANPTVTLKKGEDVVDAASGTIGGVASTENNYNEITYNLVAGTYTMTTATKTLYISHIDLEATALPTYSVTYKPGEGSGAWVVNPDASEVADCPNTFTAPTGTVFNGWKNESDDSDVEVGATVTESMNLIAQWINVYAVTFNMNGHGDDINPQDVKEGAKAAKPADPSESGWIFGGWFTDNGTFEAPFDFNTAITAATPLYAKWTEDPCPSPFTLSKVVLTSASDGTVTGYNGNEYAGEKVIGGLNSTETAEVDPSHEGAETGYKLNSGGSAIVFATLKKGTFQVGDRVVVTITKAQDAYKVEEVAQPILDIYYGTDKNDATFLTTIENVTAAGSYTYRLTAADVTAIGTKKGIGVFRPSSGRTQNPYVYSVEIKGCREWTVSHEVTFDMMGHGADIDPQTVPEGDKLTKPTVVEPEGWAFAGWYKENTLENEWDFTTDVMGTSDMTLYAKWEDETSAIKLLNGATVNHTNFITGVTADETVEFMGNEVHYAKFSGTVSGVNGVKDPTRVIAYNATTNKTKIRIYAHNNSTSGRNILVKGLVEGADAATDLATIALGNKEDKISEWIEFNNAANRTIYIMVSSSAGDVYFTQVKVIESGENAMKQAGEAGYALNLNKGRFFGLASTDLAFEGLNARLSGDYTALNSGYAKLTETSMSFTVASAMTLSVTTNNNKTYYVTKGAAGTDNETAKTGVSEFDLTAGTWYITAGSSEVQFTNIAFALPKCEKPVIETQPATNHTFDPGDMTATVVAAEPTKGTLSYQWYNAANDEEVEGATEATLTTTTEGTYYVVVTNSLAGHQDNSTKSDEAELGYRVTDDATLSALSASEGTLDPEFDPAEENYTVNLAKGTTTVPTLSATATMHPYATVVINDAAEFVNYEATSTVVVTSEDGTATKTYTVHYVVAHTVATLVDVTENTTWDWSLVTQDANGAAIGSDGPTVNTEDGLVIANYLIGDNFDKIEGNNGAYSIRSSSRKVYQGASLHMHTTKGGVLKITAAHEGTTQTLNIQNAGRDFKLADLTGSQVEYTVYVKAGDVIIYNVPTTAGKPMRVSKMVFTVKETPDYYRDVTNNIGTLCVDHNVLAGGALGATFYQIASRNELYDYKIDFEEVLPNEELKAGEPYIFQSTTGRIDLFYGETEVDAPVAVRGMIGSFANTTLDITEENKSDILYIAQNKLWNCEDLVASDLEVVANRAYIVMSDVPTYAEYTAVPQQNSAPRRRVTLGRNGEQIVTGLDAINASEKPMKIIIDGQIYILRGEKVFDATGRLVK